MCDSSDLREELDLGRPAARGDLCLDDRDLCCEEGDFWGEGGNDLCCEEGDFWGEGGNDLCWAEGDFWDESGNNLCLEDDDFWRVGVNGCCFKDDDLAGEGGVEDGEDCLFGLAGLGRSPPEATWLLLSGSSTQIGSFRVPWLNKSGKLLIRGVAPLELLALSATPLFVEVLWLWSIRLSWLSSSRSTTHGFFVARGALAFISFDFAIVFLLLCE
jgi:hypothetical protein